MKHTNGPWFCIDFSGYMTLTATDAYESPDLLDEEVTPNAEANGKLAAAAPDMYEAALKARDTLIVAKACFADSVTGIDKEIQEVIDLLNDALSKATN